jgi:hypothetical protein
MSYTTSEKTDKLFPALNEAMSSMGILEPTGKNGAFKRADGTGESKYAPLQTVQMHIANACDDHDLIVSQGPTMTPEGLMVVTTLLAHAPSSQWIRTEFGLKPDRPNVHGQVACSTYARRVALASLFNLIIDEPSDVDGPDMVDDDGNRAAGVKEGQTSHPRATVSGIKRPTAAAKPKSGSLAVCAAAYVKGVPLVKQLPEPLQAEKWVQKNVAKFEKTFPTHAPHVLKLLKDSPDAAEFQRLLTRLAIDLKKENNESPTPRRR